VATAQLTNFGSENPNFQREYSTARPKGGSAAHLNRFSSK
jgi:hypothetical protein